MQNKYCETLYNKAIPIGVNAVFLPIGKRYTPFLALHQFFHTLLSIFTQVAAKSFLQNLRWCPFIKNNVRHPNTKALAID
jgi:hypothetical protein